MYYLLLLNNGEVKNLILKIIIKRIIYIQIKIYKIRIQDYENFGFYDKNTYDNISINTYDDYVKKEIFAAFSEKHRIQKITNSIEDFNKFFIKHKNINKDK